MSTVVVDSMTAKEFLDISPDDRKAELIDGEMIVASPASEQHESLVFFLMHILGSFVTEHDLGIVRSSRTAMRLSDTDV